MIDPIDIGVAVLLSMYGPPSKEAWRRALEHRYRGPLTFYPDTEHVSDLDWSTGSFKHQPLEPNP